MPYTKHIRVIAPVFVNLPTNFNCYRLKNGVFLNPEPIYFTILVWMVNFNPAPIIYMSISYVVVEHLF